MFRPLLISLCITSTALADTWTVDDDGKADFNNIQAAVDVASDGDEIIVMPGTYTSTADEVVDMLGKEIWLHSTKGPSYTFITGEMHGVICETNETNETVIEGFAISSVLHWPIVNEFSSPTFKNCRFANQYGIVIKNTQSDAIFMDCLFTNNTGEGSVGIIYNDNSNITLTNCTFANNTDVVIGNYSANSILTNCTFDQNQIAMNNWESSPTLTNCIFKNGSGVAIWNDGSNPTLTYCIFKNNSSWSSGGGMFNDESSPMLINCIFEDNIAGKGGGMYNYKSSPTLIDCIFKRNEADEDGEGGGGMYNYQSSPMLMNCIFFANNSGFGGGMTSVFSTLTLDSCTFENNSATNDGGGMHDYENNVALNDCTFENNSASHDGGGIVVSDGSGSNYTLTDCTFENNSATYYGGGMSISDLDNCTLTNCTYTNNTSSYGGGMANLWGSNPTLTGTIACGNTPDQIYGDWIDNGGNTVEDECECLADINGDGYVNVSDLLAIIAAWGIDCDGCSEDVNNDANVNVTDLLIVVGNWGSCE